VESRKNNFVKQKEKHHVQAIECREPSPDGSATRERCIKTRLQSSAKHVVAMSVWNDEESKVLAVSYGALALLEKSKLA
jgi:hypothetical protein